MKSCKPPGFEAGATERIIHTPLFAFRVDINASSSTMATFQPALDALKKVASNARSSKEVNDTVQRVSSSLILLVGPSSYHFQLSLSVDFDS
jgi:hypothetical protein